MEYLVASYIIKEFKSMEIENNQNLEQSFLNKFIVSEFAAKLQNN